MWRDFSFGEICSSTDIHRCLGEFYCSRETQVFDGRISIETSLKKGKILRIPPFSCFLYFILENTNSQSFLKADITWDNVHEIVTSLPLSGSYSPCLFFSFAGFYCPIWQLWYRDWSLDALLEFQPLIWSPSHHCNTVPLVTSSKCTGASEGAQEVTVDKKIRELNWAKLVKVWQILFALLAMFHQLGTTMVQSRNRRNLLCIGGRNILSYEHFCPLPISLAISQLAKIVIRCENLIKQVAIRGKLRKQKWTGSESFAFQSSGSIYKSTDTNVEIREVRFHYAEKFLLWGLHLSSCIMKTWFWQFHL